MIIILFLTALVLAYANGANDNFKATATVYGSDTLSYRGSLSLATVAQITGSVVSVLVAWSLVKTFGGKGLVPDAVVANPHFLVAVGIGAAGTVLIATRAGIPISTTHALIGGLVGAGYALAPGELNTSVLGKKYFVPLLTSPLLALGGAAVIYPIARLFRKVLRVEETTCLCVGETYEPVMVTPEGAYLSKATGLTIEVSRAGTCERRYMGSVFGLSAQSLLASLHKSSAFALGFARGLNDTPKVLALLVAATWTGLGTGPSLIALAGAMALGGVLHSRRLAQTMGKNITAMNQGQGFVANAVSSTLVIGASLMGSPVSTTHVSNGALFGISLWSGRSSKKLIAGIVLAWIATLPIGAAIAFAIARTAGG